MKLFKSCGNVTNQEVRQRNTVNGNDTDDLSGVSSLILDELKQELLERGLQDGEQGIGKLLITSANKRLTELVGVKCVYAINFFRSTSFTLTKCKITNSQKEALSNISSNKE